MKLVILVWQFQQLDIAVSSSRVALIAQLDIAIVHRVSALDGLYMYMCLYFSSQLTGNYGTAK